MRAIIFFVVFTALFFPACKTSQLSNEERLAYEKKLIEKENLRRIESEREALRKFVTYVVGLKKGDTIERVFEIYGEPNEHKQHDETYTFNTVYYNFGDEPALSFSYYKDTNKIYTIRVKRGAPKLLQQKNVDDTLYTGLHADEIRKIFGYREIGRGNDLQYKNKELTLEFTCYEFRDYICSEYIVYWWY
ncbi:MAG: hypothetical protein E6767_02390 [Dysgonomonas sp.]|nr:hypothetical protein [Dysgonomonas sp.]